jgi:hypothetical protein
MRKGIGVTIALAAMTVMLFGGPASATHGGPHPTYRAETDYFQCLASHRLQNVGRDNGEIPTWGLTAPTQTLQDGGGCVQYENLGTTTGSYTSPSDLVIQGTFMGNLKTITFEVYLANVQSATIAPGTADANLLIDGEPVHTATQTVFTQETAGNIKKMVFSYTKLDPRFGQEDGDGLIEREILFQWGSYNEQQNLFAWGATDAPSKIIFNPTTAVARSSR